MRYRLATVLALMGALATAGCASSGPSGPVTSPRGKVYAEGVAPRDTDFSKQAQLAVVQGRYQQALDEAQQGIASDSMNPRHYYLAGAAYVGLGDFAAADQMWDRAEQLYPAYELEIEPDRENAWKTAFAEGLEAYRAEDFDGAIEAWERAGVIYDMAPESYQNLGILYSQRNDVENAIAAYRAALAALERVPETRELTADEVSGRTEMRPTLISATARLLTQAGRHAEAEALYRAELESDPMNLGLRSDLAASLVAQGKTDEAQAIYDELLSAPDLSAGDLWSIGISLFNARDYPKAETAFRRYTSVRPNFRDGWYNLAISLYQQEKWQELIPVAEKLTGLDPLNENAAFLLRDAYRGLRQNDNALRVLQQLDRQPVYVDQLQLRPGGEQTELRGQVVGHRAQAGSPISLRFTFYGETGEIATETVTVNAPAQGQAAEFQVVVTGTEAVTGYKYELAR